MAEYHKKTSRTINGILGGVLLGAMSIPLISYYGCDTKQETQKPAQTENVKENSRKAGIRWSPKTNFQGVQVAINRDKAQLTLDDKIRSEWTKYAPIRNLIVGKDVYIDEEFDITKHNYVELNFAQLQSGETYTYTMVGRGFPKPLIEFEFTKPNQ